MIDTIYPVGGSKVGVSFESDLSKQVRIASNPFTRRTVISFPTDGAQSFTRNLLDISGRIVQTYQTPALQKLKFQEKFCLPVFTCLS